MPYIQKAPRKDFDKWIYDRPFIRSTGDLNYIITRLTLQFLLQEGLKYANLDRIIGTLDLIKTEIKDRVVRPYENKKIKENGDVPEYVELIKLIESGQSQAKA